jgi:hypothetical protein
MLDPGQVCGPYVKFAPIIFELPVKESSIMAVKDTTVPGYTVIKEV